MQVRLKVSKREASQLRSYYNAMIRAQTNFQTAESVLLAAASIVLARKKISQALVDGVEGDELLVTVPDTPEELSDADRLPGFTDDDDPISGQPTTGSDVK